MTALRSLVTRTNVDAVERVVAEQRDHPLVAQRQSRNIDVPGKPVSLNRDNLWHTHLRCLLTTQQRSGGGGPVWTLLNEVPFPLSYDRCCEATDVFQFVRDTLRAYPGIRFRENKIPGFVDKNLRKLEAGGWQEVKSYGIMLQETRVTPGVWAKYKPDLECEMRAAKYMERYAGLGPKQSRNFWQLLGLTRFVCVLDSRVKKWCARNLEGKWVTFDLDRRKDYLDMADTLRELCRGGNVLPCLFDAAVFSTFEERPTLISCCH